MHTAISTGVNQDTGDSKEMMDARFKVVKSSARYFLYIYFSISTLISVLEELLIISCTHPLSSLFRPPELVNCQ